MREEEKQMKTITYDHRKAERQSWGQGPWIDEPDKVQWQDEKTGLPCLVVRNYLGAWCGYAGVSKDHPLFQKSYSEVYGEGIYDEEGNYLGESESLADIRIHGTLTFSDFCAPDDKEHGICHIVEPGEDDRVWWFGFDCAHYTDYVPSFVAMTGARLTSEHQYRTVDYARNETADLARQLAEIKTN